MKILQIFLIFTKFSAIFGMQQVLDLPLFQHAIDKYTGLKNNASRIIELPKINYTEDDQSCILASGDVLNQAFRFMTKCEIGHKSSDCLNPNWAIRLLDAIPTKPSGLLRRGPFFFLSDFETCRKIWTQDSKPAHYCTIRGAFNLSARIATFPFSIGLCLPQMCGPATLRRIEEVKFIGERLTIDELRCQHGQDRTWENNKPYILCVLFAIFTILIIGTLVEKFKAKGIIEMKNLRMPEEEHFDENLCEQRSDTTSILGGIAPSIALTYRKFGQMVTSKRRESVLAEIITSFSIRSSVEHLFRNSTREIRLINGIKVFTTFWVIFSHTCLFSLQFTDTIRDVMKEAPNYPLTTAFLLNSSLAVDTFLFISGCVAAFSLRRKAQFRGANVVMSMIRAVTMIVHRLFRYLPALTIYMGFMIYVYNHLSEGPFWNPEGMFGSQCDTTWSILSHFIFASNIMPSRCVPWLWHISLDFQLYLMLPICLLLLTKLAPKLGFISISSLVAICLIYRATLYNVLDLPANIFVEMLTNGGEHAPKLELTYRLMYTMPVARAPPFFIGTLTGWMMLTPGAKKSTPKLLVAIVLQLVAFVLLGVALLGDATNVVHATFHRTVWAVGLAILVGLVNDGYVGWLGYILASHRYTPLSRLSFGVFLAHEPILLFYLNSLHEPISRFSLGSLLFLSLAIYVVSLGVAWVIAIVIEIPLITLERRVLMRPAPRSRHTPRRVSFNDDGDTIYGEDEVEQDVEHNRSPEPEDVHGFESEEEDEHETRVELGDPEMTFDEKTQNWLQNGGRLIGVVKESTC